VSGFRIAPDQGTLSYVGDASSLSGKFPTPDLYRPVLAGSTFYWWTGAAWEVMPLSLSSVLATGSTTPRTLAARFAEQVNVLDYGAVGNGTTDDTTAVIAAIAAGTGGVVYFPAGTYKVGVIGNLGFGTKIVGAGYGVTTIKKATTSNVFTVEAAGVEFQNIAFNADVATNTAYGTTGAMIAYTGGAFTAAEGRMLNTYSANIDTVIQFGPDGGSRHQVIGGYWLPYTTTAGSEGKVYRTGIGGADTGARFRSITALTTDGQVDQTGSVDSELLGVSCRRVISTSTTSLLGVYGGIWGSLNQPVTVDGADTRIMGIRVSGNITLAATMSGSCVFVGNTQTSGTFTDNSPAGTCIVLHHPLTAGYTQVNKFTMSQSVNPEEIQSSRVSTNIGDASTTLTLDQSPKCVRFNTAITADRAVNLPAAARDGFRVRVVRQAGCTGAFNVNVKTSGGSTLKALGAASTWCDVEWDGPAAAFILVAAGSL